VVNADFCKTCKYGNKKMYKWIVVKWASSPCKLNTFGKRVKNVVTSKGIQVGIECK
jgi:hypothetical protein